MKPQEIGRWLAHIELTGHGPSGAPHLDDPTPTTTHQHQPPSPPESLKKRLAMDDPESPAPKRQNPALSASDTQSSASGRSSPSKQFASLEISAEGVEQRKLSLADPSIPPGLSDLLLDLQSCSSSGVGIVSSALRAEVMEQAKTDATFRVFMDHMFAAETDRDQLGPTLPVNEATRLVEEAAECQVSKQNELGWNQMVHHPLLYSTIYGRRRRDQLVGFAPCTTAKIIREYLPATRPAKMVDYCIYLDPKADPAASEAIQTLRRSLVSQVINHSDFQPFRKRPIAISIETKSRDRGRPEAAALQIGTWHSAQWRFLEQLIHRSGGSFDGLPFLPAVLVHGHDWSFAATTREGRKTVLWLEHPFGSSSDVVGVYKTAWCLQRLAQWAAKVYWPWFRENCLGVERDSSSGNDAERRDGIWDIMYPDAHSPYSPFVGGVLEDMLELVRDARRLHREHVGYGFLAQLLTRQSTSGDLTQQEMEDAIEVLLFEGKRVWAMVKLALDGITMHDR